MAGRHIAVAVAAGATTTKKESSAAIQDRYKALTRAITRKSAEIRVAPLEEDPSSATLLAALAKDLDEHGAAKSHDIVTAARELLGLIKVDEDARKAVEPMLEELQTSLVALSELEVEPEAKAKPAPKPEAKAAPKADAKVKPASSDRGSSRRLVPTPEESTTDIERSALPIWQRTDRFFLKVGVLVGVYVFAVAVYLLFIRKPPSVDLERCRDKDDRPACWRVVALEDAVDKGGGETVSPEPLQLLCEHHLDACGCAGLAYLNAIQQEGTADCKPLVTASQLDSKWPCTCTRYKFWRGGAKQTPHCGIPTCE